MSLSKGEVNGSYVINMYTLLFLVLFLFATQEAIFMLFKRHSHEIDQRLSAQSQRHVSYLLQLSPDCGYSTRRLNVDWALGQHMQACKKREG
ncbi:hypothetical protein RU639_007983 [Aspergillus parasiticus]